MASKRRLRKQGCGKKIHYKAKTEAVQAAIDYERRFKVPWMNAYRCRFCKSWHIGAPHKARL